MQRFRDGLDELLLDTYKIENLVKLLEDYFYGQNSDDGFEKCETVTEILMEKIKLLKGKMNGVYKQIAEIEKGGQA